MRLSQDSRAHKAMVLDIVARGARQRWAVANVEIVRVGGSSCGGCDGA